MSGIMGAVLYVHGKGGTARESEHYNPLFPDDEVIGLDYRGVTPWEVGPEIYDASLKLKAAYGSVILIANSVGAYFSMNAGIDGLIQRAYFISPIVDMEKLIRDLMTWSKVTEEELHTQGVIPTAFGEDLSWDYLRYVRSHPVSWTAPTCILYGGGDHLISRETINAFAEKHNANLTLLEEGEHWFHTDAQLQFLDDWIRNASKR